MTSLGRAVHTRFTDGEPEAPKAQESKVILVANGRAGIRGQDPWIPGRALRYTCLS